MLQKPILYCNIVNHNQKEIQGVCINEQCTKPRAFCFQCMRDLHSTHCNELVDFPEFEKLKQDTSQIVKQIKLFINSMEQTIKILNEIIKDITPNEGPTSLQQIEMLVKEYLKLKPISQLLNIIPDFLTQVNAIKQQNKKQQNILPKSEISLRQQQQVKQTKANNNSQISMKQTIINKVEFHFNHLNKFEKVIVSQDGLQATHEHYLKGIIICKEDIPKNGITRVIFKILKHDSTLFLGVCIKELFTIQPNLNQIGHGLYMLSGSGFVYSHHQQNQNSVKETFKYEVNNEIVVEINMNNNVITWINRQNDNRMELELETDQVLCPCAMLSKSTILIINE